MENKRMTSLSSKIVLATFIAMLMMFTLTVSGVTVGVKKDDWAKYDFSASWSSNMPGATKPPEIAEMENTDWAKVTVQGVSNTNVTVNSIVHYKNGTEKTQTMSGNIATGSGNLTFSIIQQILVREIQSLSLVFQGH